MTRGTILILSYVEAEVIEKTALYRHPHFFMPDLVDLRDGRVADIRIEATYMPWEQAHIRALDPEEMQHVCKDIPHTDVEYMDRFYMGKPAFQRDMYYAVHPNVQKLVDITQGKRVAELSDQLTVALNRAEKAEFALAKTESALAELAGLVNTFSALPWYKRIWLALRGWS